MKNEVKDNNTNTSNVEENLNIDQISHSRNIANSKEPNFNDFDADLNLSDIILSDNNDIKPTKSSRNVNQLENTSIEKYFGDDIDNLNKINITNGDMNESSIQNIQLDLNTNNNENMKTKKIITKEDLNNTPIPLFECLYCVNPKIVFQHFINVILSDKYLLQTSIYDINDLDKLISNKRITNKDDKSEKLLNLVIKNTEYIKLYIPKEQSINYFKSNVYNDLCQKSQSDQNRLFKQKIEDNIVRKKKDFYFKGINKIPKNSMNNKCLFNSTNSLINNFNALSGLVEPVQQINNNNNNNIIKNNYTIATCSNNSINFNSLSLNNNDFNCYCKDNNNMLDYIVEKIEKNDESVNYVDDKEEILDFFKFDLSRKIKKKDLKWDNKVYDIWNPDISSDFDENEENCDNEFNFRNNNYICEDTKNKSINMNVNSKYISKNNNINKSVGYIRYNIPKKSNLIFTFNKNKDKKNHISKFSDINNNPIYNINLNNNNYPIDKNKDKENSKNCSVKNNDRNSSKEIDIKVYQNSTNKSNTNININKSHDLSKFSNKYNNNYNNNYNNSSNHKIFLSGISNMKSFGSTTNSSYNFNKSANLVGKSRQKLKYATKKDNNINTKSLQYISNLNNNSSANYSIGVSINLKANSSIKSNNIINCFNPGKISNFKLNDNKSLNKSKKKIDNKKLSKKNYLFNIFNDINLLNLNHERAKSNYNMKKASKSTNKSNQFKNKNRKNNFSIYKSNNTNHQNVFNLSTNKPRKPGGNKVISRTNNLLYSSNSIFNKINKEGLYRKSLGLSFGSNENNVSENNANVVFNSISNLNKSNSNLNNSNNSNNNYSPYKFKKSYYYSKNKKEVNNKINDLISLINNKGSNNIYKKFYINKDHNYNNYNNHYIQAFKNKSINCFNSTSYLDKYKNKMTKNIYFNKSNYS